MSLFRLLDPEAAREFAAEYYQKLPFARPGTAKELCSLGNWETLQRILSAPDADVMVCRQGAQRPGDLPPTEAGIRELVSEGWTMLVRHAERHDPSIAELAAGFQADFGAAVNIHFYATPGGNWGFGWHYDAEEVFIVQTSGRKEYRLRKNTVNPWPLEETMPLDLRYEREIMPLMRCPLAAGDWLYIPSGYWHRGESEPGDIALSLAIGVMPPTAVSIYDALRRQVLDSILWRQRLPAAGRAGALRGETLVKHFQGLRGQLARDLAKLLNDDDAWSAWLKEQGYDL
jgi:50S ribosomal protein L16 3-hydroxylase